MQLALLAIALDWHQRRLLPLAHVLAGLESRRVCRGNFKRGWYWAGLGVGG